MSDTSSDDLFEAMGNFSVTSEESDKTPVITEKTLSLRNNPIAIRACILSDVVRQKPIFKAYQEFQKELGGDVMTFPDYQYYYYRFYNGELDLDHDRNLEPKMKEFSDLSVDLVGLIIEKSDYKEQLVLRKTSKSLRSLVDEQKPACKFIHVFYQFKLCLSVDFTLHEVMYTDDPEFEDEDAAGIVVRDDFEKIAFDDLSSTLKNPKLQLNCFNVHHTNSTAKKIKKYFKNVQNVLESFNHQLSVETCNIDVSNPSQFLSILPYLQPGVLQEIAFRIGKKGFDWSTDSAEMEQVASLEQWKQAEKLNLFDSFDRFPMKYATHFKRFHIYEKVIDGDKFVRIRDYLSKLDNFKHCELAHQSMYQPFDLTPFMGTLVVRSKGSKTYHYTIPDSEYYLEFKTSTRKIYIEIDKKKQSNN